MTVKALFQTWTALRDILTDPQLSEAHSDVLVEQLMQIIVAMTHMPSDGLMDVVLKLEIYGREVEAGPCIECDALLDSALEDRAFILRQQLGVGVAANDLDEHRPRSLQERQTYYDPWPPLPLRRGENSRPPH